MPPESLGKVSAVPEKMNINLNNTNGRNSNSRRDDAANKVLVTRTADEETEDGRVRNREAMAKIRDAWVYKQVRERVKEFTEYRQVRTPARQNPRLVLK